MSKQSEMSGDQDYLGDLLDSVESATVHGDEVSIDDVLDAVGRRTFAPILLIAGLVMLAPIIGDVPGVPVLMGLIVILVAGQLMIARQHIWLPNWICRRTVTSKSLTRVVEWMRPPARFVDRWTRPRLQWAVRHLFLHLIAAICIVISAATPVMELVPFSANLAGLAISAFALAMLNHDGLIAVFAAIFSFGVIGLLAYQFL